MPAVRHKFSCGHRAFGVECPICRDLKKGILIEITDKDGKKKLVCPPASEREALKRKKVKIDGKEVDPKEIEDAIVKKKK